MIRRRVLPARHGKAVFLRLFQIFKTQVSTNGRNIFMGIGGTGMTPGTASDIQYPVPRLDAEGFKIDGNHE